MKEKSMKKILFLFCVFGAAQHCCSMQKTVLYKLTKIKNKWPLGLQPVLQELKKVTLWQQEMRKQETEHLSFCFSVNGRLTYHDKYKNYSNALGAYLKEVDPLVGNYGLQVCLKENQGATVCALGSLSCADFYDLFVKRKDFYAVWREQYSDKNVMVVTFFNHLFDNNKNVNNFLSGFASDAIAVIKELARHSPENPTLFRFCYENIEWALLILSDAELQAIYDAAGPLNQPTLVQAYEEFSKSGWSLKERPRVKFLELLNPLDID